MTAPGQRVDDNFLLGWTRDSKGKVVNRHPVEVANCVTAAKRDNTQNYICCAMRGRGDGWQQQIEPRKDDLTNTITSVPTDNMVINADKDGNARTIKAQYAKNGYQNFTRKNAFGATGVANNMRIRKLTPRECFRLMGVDDADIDKIQAAGISNTQQYKMAGNSIVVDVIFHIFRKLLKDRGQEQKQQTLL